MQKLIEQMSDVLTHNTTCITLRIEHTEDIIAIDLTDSCSPTQSIAIHVKDSTLIVSIKLALLPYRFHYKGLGGLRTRAPAVNLSTCSELNATVDSESEQGRSNYACTRKRPLLKSLNPQYFSLDPQPCLRGKN